MPRVIEIFKMWYFIIFHSKTNFTLNIDSQVLKKISIDNRINRIEFYPFHHEIFFFFLSVL